MNLRREFGKDPVRILGGSKIILGRMRGTTVELITVVFNDVKRV